MSKRLQVERTDTPGATPTTGLSGSLFINTEDGRIWAYDLLGVPKELGAGGGGGGDPHYTSGGILSIPPVATGENALAMGDGTIATPADSIAIGTQANASGPDAVAIGKNSSEANASSASFGALTGALRLPGGTTAQRPGSPGGGHLRFNTSLNLLEFWNGTVWGSLESGTGGEPNQNAFSIVTGDSVPANATTPTDQLDLVGGSNISLSVAGKQITIDAVSVGETNQNAFSFIDVAGQVGAIDANSPTDTFRLTEGANITLTPTGASNTIEIAAAPYPQGADPHYTSGGTLTTPPTATGENDLAMGDGAQASNGDAVAIGTGAKATQADAIGIGKNTDAQGANAIAMGDSAVAGVNAVAQGVGANATGGESVALGANAMATATGAMQFGAGTEDQVQCAQFSLTGALTLPGGTEAQIPVTPRFGMLRKNNDNAVGQQLEFFDGTNWYLLNMTQKGGAPALPDAPTGLSVTDAITSLDLAWTDNATNEDNYIVERSPNGTSGWVVLTSSLPPNTTTYSDTLVNGGETWHYRVKCTNTAGDSGYSNVDSATLTNAFFIAPTTGGGALPAGNDTTGDGTASAPWATFSKARDELRSSGTVNRVYADGGTYNVVSTLTLSAADSGHQFYAYPGQTPEINGGGGQFIMFDGDGPSNFEFNNLRFTGLDDPNDLGYNGGNPIAVAVRFINSSGLVVETCDFDNCYQGVLLESSQAPRLRGSRYRNLTSSNPDAQEPKAAGILIPSETDDGIIAGNTFEEIEGNACIWLRYSDGWTIEYNSGFGGWSRWLFIAIPFGNPNSINNTVRYNDLEDYFRGATTDADDGGVIYGTGRNAADLNFNFSFNRIRHFAKPPLPGNPRISAIYLDDSWSGGIVEGNLMYNYHTTLTGWQRCIHFHGGKNVTFRNNIGIMTEGTTANNHQDDANFLFYQQDSAHNPGNMVGNVIEKNIMRSVDVQGNPVPFNATTPEAEWIREAGVPAPIMRDNCLWQNVSFATGETSSVQADPQFADVKNEDFTMGGGASNPARLEGFVDISGVTDGGTFTWGSKLTNPNSGYDPANYQ